MAKKMGAIDVSKVIEACKARREEAERRFREAYPDAVIGKNFLGNAIRAEDAEKACTECRGLPCKKAANRGLKHAVKLTPWNELTVAFEMCKYEMIRLAAHKLNALFDNAKIPLMYLGADFDAYFEDADNKAAVRLARHIVEHPETGGYFFGESGSGKTYLAAIIAQELLKIGKRVIFCDVPSLFSEMKDTFNNDSGVKLEDMMAALATADMLILDDLGAEYPSEWAAERLYRIVNERYNNLKPIIATSNYDLDDVAYRLNHPKKAAEGVMGDRIASRLNQMCAMVKLKGKDRRPARRI